MVFASGSAERMQALVTKAFKVSLALSLFPLGFISVFGTLMVFAWTGEKDPFSVALLAALFDNAVRCHFPSRLVLYRVTGRALLDNVLARSYEWRSLCGHRWSIETRLCRGLQASPLWK